MNDYDTNVLKVHGGSVYYDSGSDSDLDSASIESNGMSSLILIGQTQVITHGERGSTFLQGLYTVMTTGITSSSR